MDLPCYYFVLFNITVIPSLFLNSFVFVSMSEAEAALCGLLGSIHAVVEG